MQKMRDRQFRSNGKLMISGEYLVLAGASALAVPVKYGQTLTVTMHPAPSSKLSWVAKENDTIWFEAEFSLNQLFHNDREEENERVRQTLKKILIMAKDLNPNFLSGTCHWHVTTELDFDRTWGMGSSSTLISNIAWWADVNPYTLLFNTLGGSGYDVACARSLTPLIYQYNGVASLPDIKPVAFNPAYADHLFFVFTGKKQSSAKSLKGFDAGLVDAEATRSISRITANMLQTNNVNVFSELMLEHEHITAQAIGQMPVQLERYPDFDGAVKSLGAWGGDFLLAASPMDQIDVLEYFRKKGHQVIIPFVEMIL